MALREGFEPHLAVDEVTVTGRDVAALRAIDDCGSMHAAAEDLGRSYPHLQRRIDELEAAVGSLSTRERGGADGGGTRLTDEARALVRRFERLRVELSGVTSVAESVLHGRVVDRRGRLATVETPAGDVSARVPEGATEVSVVVRADAVVLMRPGATGPAATSLRNRLAGTVTDVALEGNVATVVVDVGGGVDLRSVVTAESRERLALEPGSEVVAAFKSTAARAAPAPE